MTAAAADKTVDQPRISASGSKGGLGVNSDWSFHEIRPAIKTGREEGGRARQTTKKGQQKGSLSIEYLRGTSFPLVGVAWRGIIQGWAKEWSLGCVNSHPMARGSRKAEFTQPCDHSLSDPCKCMQR